MSQLWDQLHDRLVLEVQASGLQVNTSIDFYEVHTSFLQEVHKSCVMFTWNSDELFTRRFTSSDLQEGLTTSVCDDYKKCIRAVVLKGVHTGCVMITSFMYVDLAPSIVFLVVHDILFLHFKFR